MATYRLLRHGKPPVEFDGELIAEATSDDGVKERWQSYRLFRTTDTAPGEHRYILERLGESRLPGEVTMRRVAGFPNGHQVRRAVERRRDSGERYLTIVATELLNQAASNDPEFADEIVERL